MTMGKFCWQFAIAYVLSCLAIIALSLAVEAYSGHALPSGVGIVPFIAALSFPASRIGRQFGKQPSSWLYWKMSMNVALVAMVVSLAMAGGLFALLTGDTGAGELVASLGSVVPVGQAQQGLTAVTSAGESASEEALALVEVLKTVPLQIIAAGLAAAFVLHIVVARLVLPTFVKSGMKKRLRA